MEVSPARSTEYTGHAPNRYDPAAWDVWSFGTILMYACAGRSLYKKLGKDVYRFFELTLKVRPSEPHQIQAWYRKRAKVNNECLFYETTEAGTPVKKDGRGIPQVRLPAPNHPRYDPLSLTALHDRSREYSARTRRARQRQTPPGPPGTTAPKRESRRITDCGNTSPTSTPMWGVPGAAPSAGSSKIS
jgi:hypothetical protein